MLSKNKMGKRNRTVHGKEENLRVFEYSNFELKQRRKN